MKRGTAETLSYVLRWSGEFGAPRSPRRIVEIGCGEGELAAALQSRGFDVLAIDSDSEAVAAARRHGVNAIEGLWPGVDGVEPADAILFTRSLHHISPLDRAVARARQIAPCIVIEDFAPHDVSARFVTWVKRHKPDWQPHDVHPFSTIRSAVARHFRIVHEEDVPYAYRYVAEESADAVFEEERALGERPLGRRITGVA